MGRLENKVAVITGGNSGIGFGIAEAFKNEGAVGAIVGRNQETLDRSVAKPGDDFIAINADVIDVIVANAGGGVLGNQLTLAKRRFSRPPMIPRSCLVLNSLLTVA